MNDEVVIEAQPDAATTVAAQAAKRPATLDINALHQLAPEELYELCQRFDLRLHPGRTRHQIILDLVRCALNQNTRVTVKGWFDQVADTFALLRYPALNFLPVPEDVGVPRNATQHFRFRPGQMISGTVRLPRDREKTIMLDEVISIEDLPPAEWQEPVAFDNLTPLFPEGRIFLENAKTGSVSARAVDLLTPLGRGQRGLIVAPPRVGKTIMLKEIAKAIRINHPEIVLIILLVDERPEEVTDLEREVDCQIYSSTFDETGIRHVQVAELVLERAKRLVELKQDVVVLLDSMTRLARGYNALQPGKGRTMSGGVESKALLKPKKFFGSARNVEEGGSLTILATALIDTGSKMDQVIFEEFKGTGNMELHLDRSLVEKRLYPAIHVQQSATRREELLYHPDEWERVKLLRKAMAQLPP
ncbi:MAG: transcription termination factor Rho, partial [Verrucomicrobiota bacterium]|nr:transcription termination factor Rho [Verrucomicrobiota bacterium]